MGKRIIISVISDLVTDQRVFKECQTLQKLGYEITLIGRKSKHDFGLSERGYKIVRFNNLFSRGPFMYLYFNLQLFIYLFNHHSDILWSNDLDTLLPNYLVAKLRNSILIYDSHEYFTMSVLNECSRKIWLKLEEFLFPKLKNVITVNESIRSVYENKYRVPITVLKNVPLKNQYPTIGTASADKILIIQGAGINENRGAEDAILMMNHLPENFKLYLIGNGTIWAKLKEMSLTHHLTERIRFIDTLPYLEMMEYTKRAYLGLILEKVAVSDEHKFSLPNKLFDYIQAGIPILSTAAREIEIIIEEYQIGYLVKNSIPENLACEILLIDKHPLTYEQIKENTKRAAEVFCWENEEKKLVQFMSALK
ncbi:MAG: hypothetical protein NVS3B19_14150 [Ginsengibacter sp.]